MKEKIITAVVVGAGFATALKMESMYYEIQQLKTAMDYQVKIAQLQAEAKEAKESKKILTAGCGSCYSNNPPPVNVAWIPPSKKAEYDRQIKKLINEFPGNR
ncbi:MAG: hypothetical protein JHC31_03925 [Sulfurihydrogenibium sp.]|nr:hypothetical protein [Sulfurihydrogenibium sp.]